MESFSEGVQTLVVFVFEFGFSQDLQNILRRAALFFPNLEVRPNRVISRRPGMVSHDFGNDSFPTVRSAVNSDDRRGEVVIAARRLVRL